MSPGTTRTYEGLKEDGPQRGEFEISHNTKQILGVTTLSVRDTVTDISNPSSPKAVEVTNDWFAQDSSGNVWYFGEDVTDYLPGGGTDKEGSWEAGKPADPTVSGSPIAMPGIVMPAEPRVGATYLQECAPGVAEDTFEILRLGQSILVPFAYFEENVVVTREWSPLKPLVEQKYFAPSIGLVRARSIAGDTPGVPPEDSKLVSVTPQPELPPAEPEE